MCGAEQENMSGVTHREKLFTLLRSGGLDGRGEGPSPDAAAFTDSLRLLMLALVLIVVFHGGLLPFTHQNTYDAFIHIDLLP